MHLYNYMNYMMLIVGDATLYHSLQDIFVGVCCSGGCFCPCTPFKNIAFDMFPAESLCQIYILK